MRDGNGTVLKYKTIKIPGVPGIGEKTAMDLIQRYGGIANLYQNLDALDDKEGDRRKLAAGEASAHNS